MLIARTGEGINAHRFMVGKVGDRNELKDLGVNGRVILK